MDTITDLLTRSVAEIMPEKSGLEKILRSDKKIKLYTGIDPTGKDIHIGHTVWMWKLREFQELGHHVIVLIGDFTGMIGDPTGKSQARTILTKEEVAENSKKYKELIGKIIRFDGPNPAEIRYNSEWHSQMSALDALRNMRHLTFAQVTERDMFKKRMEGGGELFINEFMYPYLQGYDSVALDVDLEVGGSDQLFNMMIGRDLLRKMKHKDKFVMSLKLLVDPSGKKIGKTEGNAIAIDGEPNTLFGQIMSLPDENIVDLFECATPIPLEKVLEIKSKLDSGENPMPFKKDLAWQIVFQYNNKELADAAQSHFESIHQKGETPTDIPEFKVTSTNIIDILVETHLASSRSDAKRLIDQNGVQVNGTKISSLEFRVSNLNILKVGRNFAKITL